MRGQGTIYHRGDALWIAWYAKGDRREAVSKLVGRPAGRVTWDDAVKALKRRLEQKREQLARGSILPPRTERLTVTQLLEEYRAHRLIQGVKRPVDFACTIKALGAWWGHLVPARLTTEDLEREIQAKLAKGFARGTVSTRLHGLYAALRWAKDRLPSVPSAPRVHVPLTPKALWTPAEVDRLCAAAKPWVADICRFGSLTGWRISEVLGLTWDRVDGKRGLLFLDETKTDDPRVRPIEPRMAELLARRTAARRLSCALVFHVDGLPITDDRFRRGFHQALAVAQLGHRTYHAFRNTAYDTAQLAGVDLFTAMDMIGHKSLSSARRYKRPNIEGMRRALTLIEADRLAPAPHSSSTPTAAVVPITR
jgi:integrase